MTNETLDPTVAYAIYFNLYSSLIAWDIVSFVAVYDSYRAHERIKYAYHQALAVGNGRIKAARGRFKISRWFLTGFGCTAAVALVATISQLYFSPPRIDTSFYTFILRYLLCFVIFCFWRAKKNNLRMMDELEHELDEPDGETIREEFRKPKEREET